MANVTTMDPPAATAPKAAKSAKPAERITTKTGYTPPVIGDPNAETDWEWLDSVSDEEWGHLSCFVWRFGPLIDTSKNGKGTSIDVIGKRFNLKTILEGHGSGNYRFDFVYTAPSGNQRARVRQFYASILDMKYPPKVPLGDWIEDNRNKEWTWCRPQLEAEEKQRVLKAAAALNAVPEAAPQSATAQLKEAVEFIKEFTPKDGNQALLIELLRQANPTNMLTLAKELAALNQPGQANNGEGSMQMMLMKYLLDEMKEARQARSNPADPMEVATNFLSKAKDLFGGSGLLAPAAGGVTKLDATSVAVQGATDILGKVVDGVSSHLPDLIRVFQYSKQVELEIAKIAAAKDMNPQKPWEYAGPTAPPNPVMNPNPNPAPPPPSQAAPPPQTYTPEPQAMQPQAMTPQLFFAKYQRVLQNHFQFLVDNFQHEDGYAFRDHLIAREGQNTMASIRGDATVDLLMQLCQSHPQLREIFQPPDKAQLFFTELLTDPNAPGEDPASSDEGDENEPVVPEVVS